MSQIPLKKSKCAGSWRRASHFISHCRTCEETSTSRCFSMTRHFDTVTDQTGSVGDGLQRGSDSLSCRYQKTSNRHTNNHTHTQTRTQGCNPQNPPKQKAPDHLSRRRHQQTNNNFCFPSCWTLVRNSSRVCLIPSEPQMSPSKTLEEQFQQLCFNFLSFWRCWLADCDLRTQPG